MDGHQTALHQAAAVGNREAIAALVHGGCALDLQDKEGNTALHEVTWHDFSGCVKLLVKAGADVNVKNRAGNSPLHLACQNGHFQAARLLLLGGALPDGKNNAGDTCLHVASRYNHLAVVKILLGSFCSVLEKNQVGDTALHVAAALNHKKSACLLLEAGADANIKNNAGHSALDKARDNNYRDLAVILAKSNQRFSRGKTVRKRRDVIRGQRRAQSLPRDQAAPEKLLYTDETEEARDSDPPLHPPSASPRLRRKILCAGKKWERVSRREYQLHERESPSPAVKLSSGSSQGEDKAPGKAFQLYTLYRDKDGTIKQAPANDCHCKPLIKTLESKLKATKMEMRSEIVTVQEEMNCRMERIEQKNKHQIKVLNKLTRERLSAERTECHYRLNQKATLEHMEGERRRVSSTDTVKSWCMSKIQDLEVRVPAEAQYYKLLRSPSLEPSMVDSDPEGLPLLSLISEESSSSLATYVNVLPSTHRRSLEFEDAPARRYYEMKISNSSDNYHNLTTPSLVQHKPLSRTLASGDPMWRRTELQEPDVPKSRVEKEEDVCDSSATFSSLSTSPRPFNDSDSEPGPAWNNHAKHLKERVKVHQQTGTVNTLEIFSQRPVESSFSQERASLHAMEVTQRFFETVSNQLERWYERKIQEAQQLAEQKALQDRSVLLEKIHSLEEELHRLRISTTANSSHI